MNRWSWKQSRGATRSMVLLGIALGITLGALYFTPPPVHIL